MGESVTVKWKKQETLRLRFCFLYAAVSSPSSFTLKTNTISTSVANSYYPGKNTEMPPVDIKTAVNVFICKRRQTVSDCLRLSQMCSRDQCPPDAWRSMLNKQTVTAGTYCTPATVLWWVSETRLPLSAVFTLLHLHEPPPRAAQLIEF